MFEGSDSTMQHTNSGRNYSKLYSPGVRALTTPLIGLLMLMLPVSVYAFPFGGQITMIRPCYNNAIWVNLSPPRGGQYIWTPATRTYQFGPPRHVGQWLLGLASAPYYCVVSIFPLIVWPGTNIDMMGSSQ